MVDVREHPVDDASMNDDGITLVLERLEWEETVGIRSHMSPACAAGIRGLHRDSESTALIAAVHIGGQKHEGAADAVGSGEQNVCPEPV